LVTLVVVALLAPAWLDSSTYATPLIPSPGPSSPSAARTPDTRPQGSPIVAGLSVVVASDGFARTADGEWGNADVGGSYSTSGGTGDVRVDTGNGRVILPIAGATLTEFLPSVSARDVDLKFSVTVDKLPQGGGSLFVYAVLRRSDTGQGYRPKIRIDSTGAIYAHVGTILSRGEQSLGREVIAPDVNARGGQRIWIRAQALGSDPAVLRIRTWQDGDDEPAYWHFAVIDWTGSLQGRGTAGVAAYVGVRTTGGPFEFAFDDLSLVTTDQPSH
jgi:hypothetical protein